MTRAVDVLFVNPGDRKQIYQKLGDQFCAVEPPVFAGLFATYLRGKGKSVAIYDAPAFQASAAEVARIATRDYAPRLVVIVAYGVQPSASTQNMGAAGACARAIKELVPDQPILITGTHAAALPERTLREEAVDFVCDGEGPVTILKTLDAMAAGSGFASVPSLWWRDGDRIVAPAASEALITDLDGEMPGIAWDLLPMERYRAHNWHCFDHIEDREPYASIHTSLGCPYRCSFCCINAPFGRPSYRMWSPETVVNEIDHLVNTYGVRNIKFVDEMFVLNKRHVEGICKLLMERPYKVNIWAYARVDTIDSDEQLAMLKAAGFNWLALGIESASDHVRDGASKKFRNADIIDICRRIESHGIRIIGNYIFGLPDDTAESMQQTLDLALELKCEFANFYSAMAYPGSRLYDDALANGLALPETWSDFSQHSFGSLPLANPHLTAAEILAFRDRAFTTYFTDPAYLETVRVKFGQKVVDHIAQMVSIPLERKLYRAD